MPWLSPTLPGSDVLVPPTGTGAIRLMFVGEAAGEHERKHRQPFWPTAPAGSILARVLNRRNIDRSSVTITNTVWWQPPNNFLENAPWQGEAQGKCRQWNIDLINRTSPTILVALGKIAFHELTGLYDVGIEQGRGFVVPAKAEYFHLPVIGTYHPSFIVRGSKRKNQDTGAKTEKQSGGGWGYYSILDHDIALALELLRIGVPPNLISELEQAPGVNLYGQAEDWREVIRQARENPSLRISYDFETPLSVAATDETEFERALGNITQFQVSLRPGHALVSSWDPSLLPFIKELMELPNEKLDWNGRGFDRDILRNLQIRVDNSFTDLMWMWHHYQRDWPMGLQFATSFVSPFNGPWKHLFDKDLRTYGARDVHEPQKIYDFLVAVLKDRAAIGGHSCLSGFERQVLLYQNTVFHPLQVRGIPIDNEQREKLDTVLEKIQVRVLGEIQQLVPEHLKPVKQKGGLVGLPSPLMDQFKEEELGRAELQARSEVVGFADPNVTDMVQNSDGEFDLVPQEAVARPRRLPKKITKKRLGEIHKELVAARVAAFTQARWVCPEGNVYVKRKFEAVKIKKKDMDRGAEIVPTGHFVFRWAQLEDFNPNSSDQLQNYINWKREQEIEEYKLEHDGKWDDDKLDEKAEKSALYKVPLDFKTKKPTTGKKEIDRLINKTSDPVLTKAIEVREMTKLRGTYIGKIDEATGKPTGWAPWPDGRVHPFYHDGPATGQGAARDPNALNYVKHLTRKLTEDDSNYLGLKWDPKEPPSLGKAIRTMIKARPGYRLVAADYKAFHVLTTGYEANDPSYMRLAKLDMHSFFAATQLLKIAEASELLKYSDKDLLAFLEALKKDKTPKYTVAGFPGLQPFKLVRDKMAKPTILGYGFGLQAAHLHHDNQEFIKSTKIAQDLIEGLDALFPVTYHWRISVPQFAERQGGFLINKYGLLRWFNCLIDRFPVDEGYIPRAGEQIIRSKKDGQLWCQAPGDDNEACVAFLPASDAFGMIREAHLRMSGYEHWNDKTPVHEDLMEKYGFIIPLHDENVFECRDELCDELIAKLKYEMEKPSEVLLLPDGSGLTCEAEFQVSPIGGNWSEMETIGV